MKKVFLYISIGIIAIGIPITIFLVGKNQDIRKRAAPATTLAFSPATTTAKAGDEFDLDVTIDPGQNQITVMQIQAVFDPTKLQALSFKNGPLTPSILISQKLDTAGTALIKVGAESTTNPITTTGTVAVLHMKALASSVTPISVRFSPDPDTYVSALGEDGHNALVGTSPASITILNADGSQATDTSSTLAVLPTATPSATLSTLSTTNNASGSAQASQSAQTTQTQSSSDASASAVAITSLQDNEQINTQTPVISGKGVPGSTITIVIHSTQEQTATVTVDANGNWTYTPTTPLAPGPHTVEAMATNTTTGSTQATTANIVVAGGDQSTGTASGSAIPITGNDMPTYMLVTVGVLLFISGALLPVFIQ